MPLCVNLSFAGYDKEKKAVLLKGPFAALYLLLPKWLGDRPVEESVETDEESEFMGSSCSESYVSSASTYSSSISSSCSCINEKNSIITSGSGIYDEEGTEKEITLEGGNRELNVDGIENDALPLHGSVLRLRDEYRNKNKEELPFYTVIEDSDKDYRIDNYFTSVFLGYDEHKNVFLLPTPHLNSENGLYAFRFSPILQISFTEMCQYYLWDYKTNVKEYGNISISFNLPLGKDYMNSPILDEAALQNVFGVSTNKVYYLSLWSVYVQFVGVAWGLPWVIQLPCDGAKNGSPSAAKESNDSLCIEPLLYCYGERPLCEIYGLCESQKDGVNTVSTTGSFTSHEEFIPRGTNYRAKLNTKDGIRTMSTPGFFLRGNKLICCGSFGVTQECDTSPEVLARFGVLHGDYLKGKTGRIFEGQEAMVLGVHMGSLVVLLDNDVRTTTLRNVQGKDDLQVLFSGVDDLPCTPKGEAVESVGENQEVTALPSIENVTEGENNDDKTKKNDDADERENNTDKKCLPEEEKLNEGEGVNVGMVEEKEEEGYPSTRVSEIPSDKIPVYEAEESDLGQRGVSPRVFVEAGSVSDADVAVDVRSESGMKEIGPSPPLYVDESGTPATTDRESSGEHQERIVVRSDEGMGENQEVSALSPIENMSEGENNDDKTKKNDDADERENNTDEKCLPEEEKLNEGEGVNVEEEEEKEEGYPSTRVSEIPSDKIPLYEAEESDLGQRGVSPRVFVEAGSVSDADVAVDVRSESGMKETGPSPPLYVDESGTPATTDRESSGEHQERIVVRSDEGMGENQEVTALPSIENVSEGETNDDKTKNDDADERENDTDEKCLPEEEKLNEGTGVKVGMVEGHTVEDQSELEVDIQRTESCEFSHSFIFTDFLKAVAYWKMGIFSTEEQREQPLAFVKYYETNTQQRMMEAVELFRKYKNIFPVLNHDNSSMSISNNKECKFDTSVCHMVQLLNQNGGFQVL